MKLDPVNSTESLVSGRWQNIRWVPNSSTGEIFNLGVCFTTSTGVRHARLIDGFDRIKCLYDGRVAKDARFLVEVTREALLAGRSLPSPTVFLSEEKFASGTSVDQLLTELFCATVPLGRRPESAIARITEGPGVGDRLGDTDIRRFVLDEVRRIGGLKASQIINSESYMQVVANGRTYELDIPLQTPSALGTIVTAKRHKPTTEIALHRADMDLQIARQAYKRDDLFMYVVRDMDEVARPRMDHLMDDFTWKFERMGVHMKTYAEPGLVAEDILQDMAARPF